jgi:CHC2 zinc finger
VSRIAEAKAHLPLPELMARCGLGDRAKKSARCPFHEDHHNSFSVWQNGESNRWAFKCHAGCGGGDEITFLELHEKLSRHDAVNRYFELAGVNGATPKSTPTLNWQKSVAAFTDRYSEGLARWRGYSNEFTHWLKENGLIGIYDGRIATPLIQNGAVAGAHYRMKDGSWRYFPRGIKAQPLVIGELLPNDTVHVFESQWDAFAFMDVSGERSGIVITRGASNGKLVADLIPESSTIYAWTQNDSAGEKWQTLVCASANAVVKQPKIPVPHKDLNEWTSAGATADDLLLAMASARSSLNSQFLPFALRDDYPKPLAADALYGLAGEIVRRILPHTEADPAALLFQFLAAFGNLIGRDHYIVADGTRHHLNLYGVLVGQSSKARKGTSWNHIANLMECLESEWREERVSFGLSSGEGLIWAVRDPIEETKPIRENGRYTGEYETYIANHGVPDKRLFVIEAEFANVLKVMAREGNTLSPVIRCAWDGGNLKTMVKNSPAKATNAHVSIVGHITRDELCRLLTQTESANGFANRFCWFAVKRSKCLPDGGAIHTVKFEDLIEKLHSVVDFAKDFVEIRRDPEAKKQWRVIYPDLSEGKPGMLGAITGRAEAQVMRLSAIYALLDKSSLIMPKHHDAAMAVWNYCEQSCQWIFGTGTGDRNADKILAALQHAANGMTKTEISGDVFNRHASSTEIDDALRLLHGLKMVTFKTESTAGAPTQRWFSTMENREISE